MNWTTEKPTRPGFYWWISPDPYECGRAVVVEACEGVSGPGGVEYIAIMGSEIAWEDPGPGGMWAGPIDPPI